MRTYLLTLVRKTIFNDEDDEEDDDDSEGEMMNKVMRREIVTQTFN